MRPVGREERKASNDKESIEKQRLRDRREEYFQFEEPLARNLGGVSAANPGTIGWVPGESVCPSHPATDRFVPQLQRLSVSTPIRRGCSRWTRRVNDRDKRISTTQGETQMLGERRLDGKAWNSKSRGMQKLKLNVQRADLERMLEGVLVLL